MSPLSFYFGLSRVLVVPSLYKLFARRGTCIENSDRIFDLAICEQIIHIILKIKCR